ncbi:MAG: adenine methylase [Patescibacteria group bacterium]|nr:adenine methylase [Patescibacteria group bacterium]
MVEQKKDISKQKAEFILNLKSPSNPNRFKRYLGSPLRYGGGKTLAVGYIVELLPNKINRVVSPFLGGASVEIAMAKELDVEVIGYDIFDLLINYWQNQINNPVELYQRLNKIKSTKNNYKKVKNILKNIWNKEEGLLKNNLSSLDLATYYYYNHNLSYGPGFLGWMSSVYTDDKKYNSMLKKVKNFKVPNLKVYTDTFEKSIPRHNKDFLYLDPPYYLEGNSKMFKGIYPMRNFPIHHNNFNHDLLVDLLKKHKGGFILSYNDCDWVREKYKDFKIREISWQYTMGQGEKRIGKNRLLRNYDNGNIKKSHEILITKE